MSSCIPETTKKAGMKNPNVAARAGEAQPRPREGHGKPVPLHGRSGGGLDGGELARAGLVALDQPVRFAAGETSLWALHLAGVMSVSPGLMCLRALESKRMPGRARWCR